MTMQNPPLVLIVDDENNILEIMKTKLAASGFSVATARDGKEGIAAAKQLHPDLILMDVHMPGQTGTDAALEIRQDPDTKDLKIAFLSSLKDPWPRTTGDRDELVREMGLQDYIEKTDDLNAIVARVRQIMGISAPRK
jgi:adenylate cyclase